MSDESVDLVKRAVTQFNARDFEATIANWHPDGEWVPAMAQAVEAKSYRGHDELRRYYEDLLTSFAEVRAEDPEVRDLGDGRVLCLYRLVVRGRDSDVTIDQPAGAVYEVADGQIVGAQSYLTSAEALRAAGLSA